jgi:uncharacterized protein
VIHASTHIPTAHAAKYILKLCRHFAHKVPAAFTEQQGTVRFLQGQCVMKAGPDSLGIYLQASAAGGIQAMQFIIDDHLRRFARLESLAYGWAEGAPDAVLPEFEALASAQGDA